MSKAKYAFLKGFLTGSAASVTCCLAYFIGIQKQGFVPASWRGGSSTDHYEPRAQKLDDMHPAFEDIRQQELKRQVLRYGEPDAGRQTHIYSSHVLSYDQARKIPLWVAEHITAEYLQGKANRRHSRFQPDKVRLSKRFSAVNEDYLGSGWSRGHMAPAGNYKFDQSSMDDTFFLTNVLPQNYENNAGFWNRLEIFCRDLTKHYADVRVISGPVFLPNLNEDGKLYIKYEVIGQNLVAVPTHLYKLVVAEEKGREEKAVAAFIVPNEPLEHDQKLIDYQVSLEELEVRTGLEFLQKLPVSQRTDLCKETGCKLMSRENFELYFLSRRLEGARNITQLEKAWSELEEKKLKPTKAVTDLYNRRLQELQSKEEKKKVEL